MNDTVSGGAVTTLFSDGGARLSRLSRNARRALKPKCQQTTVKARTIDGVTNTIINKADDCVHEQRSLDFSVKSCCRPRLPTRSTRGRRGQIS